ncbi:hypothetical protein Acy02nite_90590 [Actinoplanes cyaneus]|uniref:Uncharacterized protein n=1 Tax=Actinoplanes cyaneus TaxID=52696 RepID=A0A919ITL7_9ACTN|nr:hypothetical protein [Actinoplanes cyaneus]MCW2144485.1 hypothetical protein [Actinoplanes cyaneus]GID71178.1 hypothetical protein Acy02nite_90590 [Actinoplanes cyaneus]
MSVEVYVPANFVAAGWGTPTVCARHGEAAVERAKIRFVSDTSRWLILLGVIVYVVVMAVTRKTVVSPAWPFCARCKREEVTKTLTGWASLIVGLLLWFASVQLLSKPAPIGALVGVVLFVGGALVAGSGTRPSIAGGVVTNDGQAVRFARAHENFASQAVAAQQAAARQYAAQAGYAPQP